MRTNLNEGLLRKHFGKNAKIRSLWFGGGFNVKTARGGEVLVSRREIKILISSDDLFRAITLLGKDLWGSIAAFGDHQHVMAFMAQGEVCGVDVQVGGRNSWLFPEKERMAADVAFPFPRVNGNAGYSTDEDLENGGLL